MPQPTREDVHVDAVLTNISVAYMQDASMFVATRVFPIIPSDKQSDIYYVYTKGDWFRDEAQRRIAGAESAGSGYNLSTTNFQCETWAFHKDIDRDTRANADNPLNLDAEATRFVSQRLLLRTEVQWATDYFAAGVWATDVTPSNLWSDYSASTPISDVETGKKTILQNTGMMPNTLVLSYDVYIILRHHPDIIDRIKYTSSDNITESDLARMFEVDRVLVTRAVQNTAIEGAADAFSFIHGKHALLCYSTPTPALLTPTAGYTFVWTGVSAGLGQNAAISRFAMPNIKSVRVEGEMSFDNKLVAADLGYFFEDVVS